MKNILMLLLLVLGSCEYAQAQDSETTQAQESVHSDPTHNFTVIRLIILNDKEEMLMMREQHVSVPPSLIFESRQYLKENLDSLAAAYGIKIDTPQLHGYFSYKYDYHPYATMRSYFVARYVSGEIKKPEQYDDVQWFPVSEAISRISVPAIQQITRQIINNPHTVWGGSFMVSRTGDDHPTVITEPFYTLFKADGAN